MNKLVLGLIAAALLAVPSVNAGSSRLGGGVNYWTSIDDIDTDNIDDSGFGYVITYQNKSEALGLGLDFEILPDRFGDEAYAPQAYLTLGKAIYAGAGIGIVYSNEDFAEDPFYSFRAGLDLEIVPNVSLDLYGQYRFESQSQLEDDDTNIDTDTVFLGAGLRFKL